MSGHHKGLLQYLHLAFNDRVTNDVRVSVNRDTLSDSQQVRFHEGINYTDVIQSQTRICVYVYIA